MLTELIGQLAHHEGEGAPPDLRDVPRRGRREQERRQAVVAMAAAAAAAGLAPRRRAGAPLLLQQQQTRLAFRTGPHCDNVARHGGAHDKQDFHQPQNTAREEAMVPGRTQG